MPSILHEPAIELALKIHERSLEKHAATPNALTRDAFYVLAHDGICVHRAIGSLVDDGWPGPGAALLRVLVDINASALAVHHSANAPMAAFRYLYSGFRRHMRDQSYTRTVRRSMFDQIRSRVAMLPPELRAQASKVIREKDRPYWYSPEFAGPVEVLQRFGSMDLDWTYHQLSGAAHGSFFGLRLFRENPDSMSIDREPRGRKALSLDLSSCRYLTELMRIRDAEEGLGMDGLITAFVDDIRRVALKS